MAVTTVSHDACCNRGDHAADSQADQKADHNPNHEADDGELERVAFTCGILSTFTSQAMMMPGMPMRAPTTSQANFMPPVSCMSGAGAYTGWGCGARTSAAAARAGSSEAAGTALPAGTLASATRPNREPTHQPAAGEPLGRRRL